MSIGNFWSSYILVLGATLSQPAAAETPAQMTAQNGSIPAAVETGAQGGAMTLKPNVPTQVNGIGTVCTGIDSDTRAEPQWLTYPLRLEFAAGNRAYIADEQVTITGAKGAVSLDVHCAAPWVLAKLAPGKYSVTATIPRGASQKVTVIVPPSGQKRVVLHFPEVPAAESAQPAAAPTP